MAQTYKSGYENVDKMADPSFYVQNLIEQYRSGLLAWKVPLLEQLDIQVGQHILDVGCGQGEDLLAMAALVGAQGHVQGIDSSQMMIDEVQARLQGLTLPVSAQQGNIYHLDFPDDTFDLVRSDKVFQHLEKPMAALQEMIRVTKPGGSVAITDPDHDSLIIDSPFPDITRKFTAFRSGNLRNGGIAHQLYASFKQSGLVEVTAHPLTIIQTDYQVKKVTSPYLDEIWLAVKAGVVTNEEADAWATALETAIEQEQFLCMQTIVLTKGKKLNNLQ